MMHYVRTGLIAIAAIIVAKAVLGMVAPQFRDYL
jgi:hypothetical protein